MFIYMCVDGNDPFILYLGDDLAYIEKMCSNDKSYIICNYATIKLIQKS